MDFITRQQRTSDDLPPWAGITFRDPVDSDALAEKLRAAYPNCKTLRERKHRATIDFLSEELAEMQSKSAATLSPDATPENSKAYNDPFSDHSRPASASASVSPLGSEAMRSPVLAERLRKESITGFNLESQQQQQPTTSPTNSAQQFVWSAHDGRSMRPKTKRKMTVEERSAYKETRKRGACDKCRRQKGKCTHNDGDPQPPSSDAKKSAKRSPASFDLDHPEAFKSIKIEHSADVHKASTVNSNSSRQHFDIVSRPLVTSPNGAVTTPRASMDFSAEQHTVAASGVGGGRRWEEESGAAAAPLLSHREYVFSEHHLQHQPLDDFTFSGSPQSQEPWSPYSTREPVDQTMDGYSLGTVDPRSGNFPFHPGLYDSN